MQVYICGPGPMLEAARRIAAEQGWPESAVHFEYFKNTQTRSTTARHSRLRWRARASRCTVPAGKTILEVMRENGIDMPHPASKAPAAHAWRP